MTPVEMVREVAKIQVPTQKDFNGLCVQFIVYSKYGMPISDTYYFLTPEDKPMTFDINKPFQTRDGKDVEIVSDKARAPWKYIGYIGGNVDPVTRWTAEGCFSDEAGLSHKNDLVNLPDQGEAWLIRWRSGNLEIRTSKPSIAGDSVLAVVRVPYTHGQRDDK